MENIAKNNKLKLIRHEMNLTQKEFADKLGIKQSHYSSIESGKKDPTMRIIDSLWDLGVSYEWFFDNKGEMFKKAFDVKEKNIANSNNNYSQYIQQVVENNSTLLEKNDSFLRNHLTYKYIKPQSHSYLKIQYYERMSISHLDNVSKMQSENLEEAYNNYLLLTKTIQYFNTPRFLVDKFSITKPFPISYEEIKEEYEEDTKSLEDNKLKKILWILALEENIEHWQSQLTNIIGYIERYKDIIIQDIMNIGYNPNDEYK